MPTSPVELTYARANPTFGQFNRPSGRVADRPSALSRNSQPIYSAIAIETSLALRLVFHQPLRQTEGLLRSIADVLGINIAIPDHTTLSRRGGGLTILPKRIDRGELMHLLVDSTGLKIYGEGDWLDQNTLSGHVGGGASCTSA